ncbi:hypothetical protein [Moraxella pluranimalium]|uniref:Uncharacterized protein n=1 Tax=Moraxella pluranimalium TaxID=470453 RepID=A0A1T0CMH2_9GAMM|nr:hypothetical protein [Moraxella pluranimalium]OOS23552.1 hypothetical protein B0680_06210 [Moraxella pluranimalium]
MKRLLSFIANEFPIFAMQSLVFALVMAFSSNFFRDTKAFEDFASSKLDSLTVTEFTFTCLAVLVIAGLLSLFEKVTKNMGENSSDILGSAVDKLLLEMPKLLYLIGSSIGTLGIVYGIITRECLILRAYAFIWVMFFFYGSIFTFFLTPKPHSKEKTHEQYPS